MAGGGVPPTTPGADVTIPPALLASLDGAWLTSWWVVGVAVTAAVLLSALTRLGWRRLRALGRRRRALALGAVLFVSVAWMGVGATAANAAFGLVPDGSALLRQAQVWTGSAVSYRTGGGGRVRTVRVPGSTALAVGRTTAWVYTPPGFDATGATRYPVTYLVHGTPGSSADWFTLGRVDVAMDALIGAGIVPPTIVVTPDVNAGPAQREACLDVPGGPQVESWIYHRLVPFVDATYPTLAGRQGRTLGGMSSGGYCALDQGLRHQDIWGTVLSFEPAFNTGVQPPPSRSPVSYLPTIAFTAALPTYLDVGSRGSTASARGLAQQLADRGQTVLFRVNAGQGHTWAEVRAGLPYALAFAARQQPRGAAG